MNASEIKEQASFHFQSFGDFYREALSQGGPEAVHQYRVSLKRFFALKAFVSVNLRDDSVGQLDELVQSLRPVYKLGGKLRDLQVLMSLPASLDLIMPPSLYAFLYQKYQKRLVKFTQLAQETGQPGQATFLMVFDDLMDRFYTGGEKELCALAAQNFRKAEGLLRNRPGKEWHEARRLIKQNYLLMQMAVSYQPDRFPEVAIQGSRQLEQSLGLWHDTHNLQRATDKIVLFGEDEPLLLFGQQLDEKKATKEEEIRELVSDNSLLDMELCH
jgi:CHAD domain-containing protein